MDYDYRNGRDWDDRKRGARDSTRSDWQQGRDPHARGWNSDVGSGWGSGGGYGQGGVNWGSSRVWEPASPGNGFAEHRNPPRHWQPGPDFGRNMDYPTAQSFAGRGPRGYKRSDERILEDVCEHLTRDPRLDASNIEITVTGGEVTLGGEVDDRHDKRLAEDIAEEAFGVVDVHNRLKVRHGFLAKALGDKSDEREVSRRLDREGASRR